MKETWKLSGKKNELTTEGKENAAPWTYSLRPGGWIIAQRGSERRRFQFFRRPGWQSASASGRLWSGELQQKTHGSEAGIAGTDSDLNAQFPGKVRKILVQAGQKVTVGQPLILVEAMKMEFEIKAPSAGLISAVRVKEGQQLSPGDRFFDFVGETSA